MNILNPPCQSMTDSPLTKGARRGYIDYISFTLTNFGGVGTLIGLATITNWGKKGILTMSVSSHKGRRR